MNATIHENAIVIDGLEVSNWSREVFEAMRAGGLTAVNCTCAVWEGFTGTMANIAAFKGWFAEHSDLIRPVATSADIHAAKAEKRVGIILGWQNLSPIEDKIPRLALFKDLGVGIAQLTYNTQNLFGSGCYETTDGGLSGFGHEVVEELNRVGILIDLSHVGPKTSRDVVRHSRKPVAYTHVCPAGLKQHPRNKTDDEIRAIAERGGVIGVTLLPWFLAAGKDATIDDYLDALEHVIDVAGEDHVGIGTDFMQGHGSEFLEWVMRDKGYARLLSGGSMPELLQTPAPAGIQEIADFPNLTDAMTLRGWPEDRIRKVLGENWLALLTEVWGS